jgi:hypothetical protein
MSGDKEGTTENAVIISVISSKQEEEQHQDDHVPIEGDDSNEEELEDATST